MRTLLVAVAMASAFLPCFVHTVSAADNAWSNQGVSIVESNQHRLVLQYTPKIVSWDTLYIGNSMKVRPNIIGTDVNQTAGGQTAYVFQLPIAVPDDGMFAIRTINAVSVRSCNAGLAAWPQESADVVAAKTGTDEVLSSNSWADIKYLGVARDLHVAGLRFVAARYNDATGTTEIPTSIQVEVDFMAGKVAAATSQSPRSMFRVVNADAAASWRVQPVKLPGSLQKGGTDRLAADATTFLRVGVDEQGIYSISAQRLSEAGIVVAPGEVPTIKLYGHGGKELPEAVSDALSNELIEQPLIVKTNDSGELESIVFYGASAYGFEYDGQEFRHFINHYSNRNYYILGIGGSAGLRAESVTPPSGQPVHTPDFYVHRMYDEQELNNPYTPGSGRRWLGRTVDQNIPATYFPRIENLLNQGDVLFRYMLGHKSSSNGRFDIRFGQQEIGTMPLESIATTSYQVARLVERQVSVPASSLTGAAEMQFDYSNNTQNQAAFGYVDWFEIHYPRPFRAIDNSIEFFSDQQKPGLTHYNISGFSGNIIGFDVTDRARPQLLLNQSSTGGAMVFNANSNPVEPARYFVSGQTRNVASLDRIEWADLRESDLAADYVIITHRDLLESAREFKAYREARSSLKIAIVTTDQLYNEYASGMPDPTAVRDFLAHAMADWSVKPRYALMWGDGHYDYRSINTTQQNLVPTYQSLDLDDVLHAVNTTFLTEDYFVMVVGDDVLVDIALGRIPVTSNSQGSIYTEKLAHYERESSISNWRTTITLIADDSQAEVTRPGDGSLHTTQSERLAGLIPSSMKLRKIYLPDYPTENIPGGRRKPKVTQDIVSSVNSGTLLLNWIGHGNPRVWAHEQIFEKDETIALFQNNDKPFFLTAATCDFGRFDDPSRQSGAEDLLFKENGGAIGIFSSARTVYANQNARINETFYGLMFDDTSGRQFTSGEVLFHVKQERTGTNDRKFYLLGDPAMNILIPQARVYISKINGIDLSEGTSPRLQALSTVEIEGYVAIPGSEDVDNTFNGSIVLNLHDSDIEKEVTDTDQERTKHDFSLVGGILNVSGAEVLNGRFKASIVVPKDISFSDENGRLYGYAFNESATRFAKGSTQQFTVGGITTDVGDDNDGPQIDIYLDNRTFVPGDYVQPVPLLIVDLADATGINATGLGIGHDIQAWIDGSPETINLTGAYTVSLDNFRTGTAEQELFDLECGDHSVRVRAWDVFNNFSESETFFRIPCGDGIRLDEVGAFPNPFQQETKFVFRHSAPEVVATSVQIYTTDGMRVRQLEVASASRTDELSWDGRDDEGNLLPTGPYWFRLQVQAADGSSGDYTGQVLIIR